MPDELGLEVEDTDEDLGPPLILDDDTPDDSDASPTDPPQKSETASELAKKLNVEELPADAEELYALASKRLDELRDFGRKSGEDTKAEIKALRAELDQYKQAFQPPRPKDGPPVGASDEEILKWYTKRAADEELTPVRQQLQQLAAFQAEQMVLAARSKYPDFEKNEDAIGAALSKFPQMSLDEAYKFVTADTAEERALEKLRAQIQAKKEKAGTLTSGGMSGTTLAEPADSEVREIPDRSFWARAFKAAKREHQST